MTLPTLSPSEVIAFRSAEHDNLHTLEAKFDSSWALDELTAAIQAGSPVRVALQDAMYEMFLKRVTEDGTALLHGRRLFFELSDPVAPADDRHTFSSGAMSSGRKPRYDLIPQEALRRIAKRFALGATKYGDFNWRKGVSDKEFILDRLNHAVEHLYNAIHHIHEGTTPSDDDLAAVVLNAIFAMEYNQPSRSAYCTEHNLHPGSFCNTGCEP